MLRRIVLSDEEFEEAERKGEIYAERNYPKEFYELFRKNREEGKDVSVEIRKGSAQSGSVLYGEISDIKYVAGPSGSLCDMKISEIGPGKTDRSPGEFVSDWKIEDDDSEMKFDGENEAEDNDNYEACGDGFPDTEEDEWKDWLEKPSETDFSCGTLNVFPSELEVSSDGTFLLSFSDDSDVFLYADYVLNAFLLSQSFFSDLNGVSAGGKGDLSVTDFDVQTKERFSFDYSYGSGGLLKFDCSFCFGNIVCRCRHCNMSAYFCVNVLSDVKRVSSEIKPLNPGEYEKYSKNDLKIRNFSYLVDRRVFVSGYERYMKGRKKERKEKKPFGFWNLAFWMCAALCVMLIAACYNYRSLLKKYVSEKEDVDYEYEYHEYPLHEIPAEDDRILH